MARVFAVLVAFFASNFAYSAPPGAIISNQATLYHEPAPGVSNLVPSNIVELTTAVVRSPSSIAFTRVTGAGSGDYQETVGPAACLQGNAWAPLPEPVLSGGGTIDPTQLHAVSIASFYNLGEPLFVRLDDSDQNLDYQAIDVAVVTVNHDQSGDTETIRLSETGVNTGVFAGYVPSARGVAVSGDCVLQGTFNSTVRTTYTDPADGADSASAQASLDPASVVFESRTGALVDGARVELVDAVSGAAATVYGNDGTSIFPSSLTTGESVTDSSGTNYDFGAGQYRFPVVADGDYRVIVTPPPEYAFPSAATIADLQNLPGAPFVLDQGSFGSAFTKSGGPSFNIDIPVDPLSTALFLQKRTTTTTAAPGDFVRYELTLDNASATGPANDVEIVDHLPPGVRFVEGSTRLDGDAGPDPVISADARTLEFDIGTLDAAQSVTISYVIEIIGGERNDELLNVATAFADAGLVSNEASALILLTEDLFRSTGTIIGRVLEADCSQAAFAEDAGVAEIRVYLEDGRYAVTDEGGRFHFEGLKPGTHVAQLDTITVPEWFDVVGCGDTAGFAGSIDSQFVKLTKGGLVRADFYLKRKPRPEGRLDLELRNRGADSAEQVAYELELNGIGNVAVSNILLTVLLPEGVSYAPGSMRVDGKGRDDPGTRDNVLQFSIDDRLGNWSSTITFVADIDAGVDGELTTRAVAKFDTPMAAGQETPLAQTRMLREPAVMKNAGYVLDLKFAILSDALSPDDKRELDRLIADWRNVRDIQISATGHSDSQPIAARNRHLFADNYVLSRARAMSAASYVAAALDVPVNAVQVDGRGPDDPVDTNATAAGRQANRRVEMVLAGIRPSRPSFLEVTQETSGTQVTPTRGAIPGEGVKEMPLYEVDPNAGMPTSQVKPAVDSLEPGIAILLPERDWAPAIPSTKISIRHAPEQTVKIYLNDMPLSSLSFDSTDINRNGTVAVSNWKGVNLEDGDNEIRVVVGNPDGSRAGEVSRNVYFSGPAVRGEFVEEKSNLVADGKARPVVAVRLFDRAGKPSRAGTTGAFRIEPPYRSWWDVENDRKNDLITVGAREPSYRVGEDGIAYLELEPTTQAGELTLNLKFEHLREQEIRAWLTPASREWILVGFAEGTAAYNTLSDNVDAALAAGHEAGYSDDGRVAFFAKGSIKGEYLLSIAYDSARDRSETRHRFENIIDPNAHYPLFADTSEQRFEAPSQRKLYVKLEKSQFIAMFGDYDTGLSVTELARYERRFNGFKSEFRGRNLGYTVFAADTDQAFRRDEIQGDGTSGLYQLSSAPIVANSDSVRIEIRDRFDSGQVLSSTQLTRFLDYNLDTFSGTIFFKRPVPSRDTEFNPVYIVAEYESISEAEESIVAGARASVRMADDNVEIGVTHVNDSTAGAEADMSGVDVRWQISQQTLLKAEVVSTNSTMSGVEQSGTAQSVEVEHSGGKVDVRAFIREVDEEFGLGHQSAADRGFRRVGIDMRSDINEYFAVEGEAAWQQNLDTGDSRDLVHARLRYKWENVAATFGLVHAADDFEDGESRDSNLAELGIAYKVLGGKLTLRAGGSTALGSGEAESTDFPKRIVLGADYALFRNVDLVAEWEDASGQGIDATMTRLGVRAKPWQRAQVNSYITEETSEFGPRLFANVGFVQGFQLNEKWTLDIGLDQTDTLTDADARPFDTDRELVSGSLDEDFVAMHAGAMYTAEKWSANTRLEHRNSDSEDRSSLLFGWYRQPAEGHGLSAAFTMLHSENVSGTEITGADLKFGWAYRMAGGKWSLLDRIDLVFEEAALLDGEQNSWRLINNFNANRRFSASTQLSLQYAFKYVRSEFDDDGYSGYTDLVGVDFRRGIRGKWDFGVNTSLYHSWNSEVFETGFGLDVGYNVRENMWLTLGYNFSGFDDSDFAQARYTAQGPYVRFHIKADQQLLKRITGRR